MKKIVRNMSTPESRAFWQSAERNAIEVRTWPAWRRAGINEAQLRREPREVPPAPTFRRTTINRAQG